MNRTITTLFILLVSLTSFAQELTIKSFTLASSDISASTNVRRDNNEEACALIKVRLATPDAAFYGNVVGNISYKMGEYWVYMTIGTKRLQVKHENYLPLDVNFADYGINSLKGKCTYVLTLIAQSAQMQAPQQLNIKISPKDAVVLIDGDIISLINGQASLTLPLGSHSYNVTKEGFMKQMGEIKLVADTPGKLLVELDRNNKSTTQQSNNTPAVVQTNTSVQTKSVPITTTSNNSHTLESKNVNMKDGESATLQSDLNAVQSASNSSSSAILNNDNADYHEYVDLGLSVKWATCNVGAIKPEDYGNYYAWGETITKDDYNWTTYKYGKNSHSLIKYCIDSSYGMVDNKIVLDSEDDAAHANWGGLWRMPTKEEYSELQAKCKWKRTTQNGVKGYRVTSKINGNSIFLPAAGCRNGNSTYNANHRGYYWSSSLNSALQNEAVFINLYLDSDFKYADHVDRNYGLSVRPVCP